jgi:hypothetical protein
MADAVPAQIESVPTKRDTRKVVDADKRNAPASPIVRVSAGEEEKTFTPLANPGRAPEPRKRGAYRKARAAVAKREENFKGGVEDVVVEAVEEVDSVEG